MSKQYKVTLHRKGIDHKLPYSIDVIVIARTGTEAKALAENSNPSYRAFGAQEVKQPKAPPVQKSWGIEGSGSARAGGVRGKVSNPSENLGCGGIIKGGMTLVGLLIVLAIVSQCSDKGSGPSSVPATATIPEANLEGDVGQGEARAESLVGMKTTPQQEAAGERAQPVANAASQSAGTDASPSVAVAGHARVVDSRERIVLQSGPKMSSKNVAKINTGSVVQVISDEGKWVEVRTEDGMIGYVRKTQLEPLQ